MISSRLRFLPICAFGCMACGGNVVVDSSGQDVSTGGATSSSVAASSSTGSGGFAGASSTGGFAGAPTAQMALVTTTPDPQGPCAYTGTPSGTVYLLVSNLPITCSETLPAPLASVTSYPSSDDWEICFGIFPGYFVPATYGLDLEHPWGFGAVLEERPMCEGDGDLGASMVTIEAIGTSSVSFSLSGTNLPGCFTPMADGSHTALRCP